MTAEYNPFRYKIRDLVGRPGEMRVQRAVVASPKKFGEGMVAVAEGNELAVDIRLESVYEGILATAEVDGTATGECSRCLIDIELPVRVEFQELFAYHSGEAFEYEVQDNHVDLEPLIRDAVVLALPFQPVCQPDCPGLDPETGERLADHPELVRADEFDPRWAALRSFGASDDRGLGDKSSADVKKD